MEVQSEGAAPATMQQLPQRFVVRSLESTDFDKAPRFKPAEAWLTLLKIRAGYLRLLGQLTVVGEVSKDMFNETLQRLKKLGDDHHIVVIEDTHTGQLVATGSIFIEHKFLRNCGKVGHLEDAVVDQSVRGCGLGQRVIESLTNFAKDAGCYKAILDCKPENASFYEKCGYSKKEIQMAKYF